MTEIDQIRGDLEAKLNELSTRLPPMVQWGRRTLGGLGGGVALFVLTRARMKMKQKKGAKRASKATMATAAVAPVVVKGGLSTPAAIAVAAVWAGVRIFEAKQRSQAGESRGPAIVRALPAGRRNAT